MGQHRLLGICGALRRGSTNRKLLLEAARMYGDAEFAVADLRLPLYDGDLETSAGIPTQVQTLADQIANSDAVLIASPEYNKALTGVLKNALDWVSRVDGNPWLGKPVAIMSANAGRTGGEAGQFSLRLAMVSFNARLLQGPQVMIANSGKEFDADDRLQNERSLATLEKLVQALHNAVDDAG
ncbi:MAG: NAD(P)H-dependent oxidoreductase [Rhodobacter sp.]|nr:NAD(P)H-dependent oxidoreductase [Rhodobacter sp.]